MSEGEWIEINDMKPDEGISVECREITMQKFRLKRIGFGWGFSDGKLFDGFDITHWREINGG